MSKSSERGESGGVNVGGNPSPGLGLLAKESEKGKDLSTGVRVLILE